jgi:hypothetical protein
MKGCLSCGATGYEDYPSNKIPCRKGCPDTVKMLGDLAYFPEYRVPWEQDAKCPHCGEMNCQHWTGRGWSRDK